MENRVEVVGTESGVSLSYLFRRKKDRQIRARVSHDMVLMGGMFGALRQGDGVCARGAWWR